jgi:hypothetical protein
MARFIKKPVIIEAEQLLLEHLKLEKGVLHKVEFFGKTFNVWFIDSDTPYILIPTLEGNMIAKHTDWIIKGIKGELYPCREDIFHMTYDKA